ncbi:MAG: response regulator transcription factor [Anaerolineae bacterium]
MSATILIVDNYKLMRQALREWLRVEFPGCHVIEAANGEEAVTLAQVNLPHLVIMDIGLPGMNGLQATNCLKAILPTLPVVLLTLYGDDETTSQNYKAETGASACVPKIRVLSELQPTLAALLPV